MHAWFPPRLQQYAPLFLTKEDLGCAVCFMPYALSAVTDALYAHLMCLPAAIRAAVHDKEDLHACRISQPVCRHPMLLYVCVLLPRAQQYVPLFLTKEDLDVAVGGAYRQRNAAQISAVRDKAAAYEEEYAATLKEVRLCV